MEKITSHDGIQIAYQRSGTGPPLILVHGTGGSATRWAPVAPTLAEHFSVYAVDRRGSPHPAARAAGRRTLSIQG
jgi:pimeloyl-ACP methyl ester carboxylesterase